MTNEKIPTAEDVTFGRASIPEEIEERISFLCKVFDPSRASTLIGAREEFKIAEDYFAELLEDTRHYNERSIRAGATARAAAQVARRVGLISSDEEEAKLISSLLEPLREAGDHFVRPVRTVASYGRGEGHLSRAEADHFDGLFYVFTSTAEVLAAGIDWPGLGVLRESLKPVGV